MKITLILAFAAVAASSKIPPTPTFPTASSRIDITGGSRIVGGSDAAEGAYPFIVSIRLASNNHVCGGSIINNNYVLTAAHCLIGRRPADLIVVAGTNRLTTGGVTVNSGRFILHPNYNENTIANDIAIIALATPLIYSDTISAAVLNTAFVNTAPATVIGWGRISTAGPLSDNLQQLSTNIISHTECLGFWSSWVSTSQVCALSRAGEGVCSSDSGGPLIISSTGEQEGVVSFGSSSCGGGNPDVYARVSVYIDWINSVASS